MAQTRRVIGSVFNARPASLLTVADSGVDILTVHCHYFKLTPTVNIQLPTKNLRPRQSHLLIPETEDEYK